MSSESTKTTPSPPQSTVILTAAVITGAVLRLLLVGSKSLWLDEMLTIRLAEGGLEAIVEGSGISFYHPPLYFVLSDYWMALGQSEVVLRLPSALFGVLAILMAYLLARELFGTRTGLTAAWLVSVSPTLVWYSQEARGYSLLIFLALLSTLAFVKLFRKPHVGWWLLYVVATAAALYTHYVAFLLLLIHLILVLALSLYNRHMVRQRVVIGLAWLVIGLAYLPWARTPAAATFAELFHGGRAFIVGSFELSLDRPVYELILIGGALIVAVLAVAFLLLRPRADWVRQQADSLRQNKIVQILLILFFLALLVVSVIPRGYSVKRQLLILVPFVLIFYAWFWPWVRERRTLLVSLILLSFLASLINVVAVPKAQWRETAAYVDSHSQPADVMLLVPNYMNQSLSYYTKTPITVERVTPAEVPERLPEIASGTDRIWLISHQRDVGDPNAVIRGWLKEHGAVVDEVNYYNIQTELFQMNAAGDG